MIDKGVFEWPPGCCDIISCAVQRSYHRDNFIEGITITVNNESAGDTETGFGYECSITIDKDGIRALIQWLQLTVQNVDEPEHELE